MNEYEGEWPYVLHGLNRFLHSNAWTNNLSLATASKVIETSLRTQSEEQLPKKYSRVLVIIGINEWGKFTMSTLTMSEQSEWINILVLPSRQQQQFRIVAY